MRAAANDILSAQDVRVVILLPRSPEPGDCRGVIDNLHLVAGTLNVRQLSNIALKALGTCRFKARHRPSHQCPHALAARRELLGNMLAEKTAGAGDKAGHARPQFTGTERRGCAFVSAVA